MKQQGITSQNSPAKPHGITPIRRQYLRIKENYPQAIVLFRLGDFYETFDDDAKLTARELDIVLTAREMGKGVKVPMAGIPHHALESYLAKLIQKGHKVAICEQITKPGETKGIVERDVVRVVTPGTVIEPNLLDARSNNYLVGLIAREDTAAIAYVDITTSEFAVTQLPAERLPTELERLHPAEIVTPRGDSTPQVDALITPVEEYWFETDTAREVLLRHFRTASLDGYGCGSLPLAISAAGAVIHYLEETQKGVLKQLTRMATYSTEAFMALDTQTQRNLEIFTAGRSGGAAGSLLSIIDLTRTTLGSRQLRRWLGQPLMEVTPLKQRQDAIEWFFHNTLTRQQVTKLLGEVADLERLANRVRGETATPRDLISLRRSLEAVPDILQAVKEGHDAESIKWLSDELKPHEDVTGLIADAIAEDPGTSPGDGGVIRPGFSDELDKLHLAGRNAKQYLANLEREERTQTGIKSLKVGYNKVFGYYIEVSKANMSQVPERYIRKQTLVGGERFFTAELKEYESMILNARERIGELESEIFRRVCAQVATASERILKLAQAIADTDVYTTLAEAAVRYNYVRPKLSEGSEIIIRNGRHPVVERNIPEHNFIPNDSHLANDDAQLIILTGPNMAGKSTYLRQVALIVLLAQIGSFVPAEDAEIGLVDRIFTRIGAGEDIAAGQSTFMVEMVETANILNNATARSLIILDEIGRGTSTYDGLAIARAVVEYIHNAAGLGAKTLFATHYHELVEMAAVLPRVRNFNIAVTEDSGRVIFLYRVMPGGVDKSYGIHVAQLAGLPRAVINRAGEVLQQLELDHQRLAPSASKSKSKSKASSQQMNFFGEKSPVVTALEKIDINSMTPLEALNKLYELQQQARQPH